VWLMKSGEAGLVVAILVLVTKMRSRMYAPRQIICTWTGAATAGLVSSH
jgi:hypothetical protein